MLVFCYRVWVKMFIDSRPPDKTRWDEPHRYDLINLLTFRQDHINRLLIHQRNEILSRSSLISFATSGLVEISLLMMFLAWMTVE